MNLTGYQLKIPELVQTRIGKVPLIHYFVVYNGERMSRYLSNSGWFPYTDEGVKEALKYVEDIIFYQNTSIEEMDKSMGIKWVSSEVMKGPKKDK